MAKENLPSSPAEKALDPNGMMGAQGAPYGAQGTHHGSVRGQSVGPAEGMRRAETGGNAPGGSELASAIAAIVKALATKSGVPNPSPAPPSVPGMPGAGSGGR
jgi:hypothetical protein